MQNNSVKLFTLSCITFAMGGLSSGVLGVVWIYIQGEFGLSLSALGVLVSVSTLGRLVTSFTSGSLIGRFGIAWVLIMGTGITALSMLGFGLAPVWILFLLSGFMSGVGAGAIGTGINAFAAVNFSSSRMNWIHASFGMGATLGPILVTLLVIDLGFAWQWSYLLITIPRIALVIWFVMTRHQWKIEQDSDQAKEVPSVRMTDTLRLPLVWLLIMIFLVGTGIEMTTGQFANTFLIEGRAIDPKTAGIWVSMYWGSLTVSRFLVGFVINRISNGLFLRMNMLGMILGTVLLWSNLSPITSLLGLAMIGFTVAPFVPLMTSDTPRRVGTAHTANTIGFQFTGSGVGIAFLPWLAGILAESLGLESIPPLLFVIALSTFLLHELILRRETKMKIVPSLATAGFSPND